MTEFNEELFDLLQEAVEEGLMDTLRGAVGLKPKEDSKFKIIPKEQWEELLKHNRRTVEMLANTPGPQDAASIITEILKELVEAGSMEARKAQQQIRLAVKKKDKIALMNVIRGIQQEADAIRTVRTGVRLRREDSPKDIAELLSEDVHVNNGLLL